jgi:osmotically-inducible protein OsmY
MTDRELQESVLKELAWDEHVAPTDIGVAVHAGVVTLHGMVPSWAARMAAEHAARRVRGVLDVANNVHVKPAMGTVTDTDIALAVRNALKWDVFVPDERIQSTVHDGIVTLEGTVETYAQREDAERAVRNLAGVTIVLDEIEIDRADITPEQLRAAIHDALERRADRETEHVHLDVEGGRVTLHGRVQSWREREAVVGAVTGTRGVQTVVDRLRLG